MNKIFLHIVLVCSGLLIGSCQKELPNQPKPNQHPSTRVWLSSSDTLNETSSRQHAYWYGEDPDGYVKGYLIAVPESLSAATIAFPDTFSYVWTTKTDSIIPLPLLKQRSLFTIVVRAVDNTFNEQTLLSENATIRLTPQPYWDANVNGVYDGSDALLPSLTASIDTKSASQLLPIKNTPPKVFFAVNPIDSTTYQQPETTFTVATFSWYATDIDGDQTISSFRIALNDTNTADRWFTVNGSVKLLTLVVSRSASDAAVNEVDADLYTGTFPNMQLRGKVPGLKLNATNILYLQAKDVAGEFSPAMTMPSTPATRRWYVKKPKSRLLVVADYNTFVGTPRMNQNVFQSYRNFLSDASVLGGTLGNFDVLDVGYGLNQSDKQNQSVNQKYGSYVPTHMNPALIQTFKLFDLVLWVTDLYPSFLPAQIGLFNYTSTGGKVIFSTYFSATKSYRDSIALRDFAPIDSVSSDPVSDTTVHTYADNRIYEGTKVLSLNGNFPDIAFDSSSSGSFHSFNWRRIYKRAGTQYLYKLDSSKFYFDKPPAFRYKGTPEIGCMDDERRFVFIAMPLHLMNGNKNLPLFFKRVIENEFGLN